ncbi:MAG: AAA family ATPase [Planctomycetes bacterium]|nr:AAA family ATPase [Planctomycetota bacterium]
MISRLHLLRNLGVFDYVDSGADISLARLTLIYAENGRGKTTLTAILRSLATGDPIPIRERRRLAAEHPPHVVLDCDNEQQAVFLENEWNRTLPNITVFDDAFVDENVCSGLAVDPDHRRNLHELILGAEGVALNRRLKEMVVRIEEHNQALRRKEQAIPASERGSMSVDAFCALPARLDIDEAIQGAEQNLAAARAEDSIRETRPLQALRLPKFDLMTIEELLRHDLPSVDATAMTRVQEHLARIGDGGEGWVAEGMNYRGSRKRAGHARHRGRCLAEPACRRDRCRPGRGLPEPVGRS